MTLNTQNNTSEVIENKSIKTLDWFIKRQNEIQKQVEAIINIWKNHQKLLEKVLSFKSTLIEYFKEDIDPIKYLEKLYFEEKLSIESMVSKLKEIYTNSWKTKHFYNSSSALQKFLKDVLNWELRNSRENKTTKVYKARNQENVVKSIRERHDQKRVEFLSWYVKYSKLDMTNFDKNKLNSFSFKYEKFMYLLTEVFWINLEDFKSIKKLSFWEKFISDRFNEIFDELIINFTIWHKDIKRVFEKYK